MKASKSSGQRLRSVLVTGDLAIDNYLYEGEKYLSSSDDKRPLLSVKEPGGSFLIYKTLDEINKTIIASTGSATPQWNIFHAISFAKNKSSFTVQSSYSIWKLFTMQDKKQNIWRMGQALGYGNNSNAGELKDEYYKIADKPSENYSPDILVISDGAFSFRKKENRELWGLTEATGLIILKLTSPCTSGDLWYELMEKYSGKLIIIAAADELRNDGAKISRGYSWEQTIEDTLDSIYNRHNLKKLLDCKHLIVTYSMDGALWINNEDAKNGKTALIYDSARAEGEFEQKIQGKAFGNMSCFLSSIANSIMQSKGEAAEVSLFKGIKAGLGAMRNLIELGHGRQEINGSEGFPAKRIAGQILKPEFSFSRANLPFTGPVEASLKEKWMIVDFMQNANRLSHKVSLFGLATQIVFNGTKVLNNLPHAKFGHLITVDRSEIETLRRIRKYMIKYNDNKTAANPISFGIFGPPGAGKSFGVKQIVNEIFGSKSWLEFNMSQFNDISELNGAFHQIRDIVLSGITPIAFWDEFDSKNYYWLQYFLAPMQSGTFQEGQLTHMIGKCIFIFAGATSYTYEAFGNFKEGDERLKDFKLLKGPDFKSRLDSYYNVLGPNQRIADEKTGRFDQADTTYYLRRAIFITSKINYNNDYPAEIDFGLINALLTASKYKHGSRSFDKLLTLLQTEDKTKLNLSLLPPKDQLDMYVDSEGFIKLLNAKREIQKQLPLEELARAIHDSYRDNCHRKNIQVMERFEKAYTDLDEEAKEDNRASVLRIQEILSIAGLKIVKKNKQLKLKKGHEYNISSYLEFNMELLAEAEHNGWRKQRLNSGWRYGKIRDDEKKIHSDLLPYKELTNEIKEKDRETVRGFYKKLNSAGFAIDWI